MIEIIGYERSFKTNVTQRFDLICKLGVGVSVNHRNLVPLGVSIQLVIRMIRRSSIP